MLNYMAEQSGDEILAKRLRAARDDTGLTQTALAELAGVSQRNISDLETERRGTRVEPALLRRLAEILGVSVGYLLGDSHEPFFIPGWEDLTAAQQEEMRALIRFRARLNRMAGPQASARAPRGANAGRRRTAARRTAAR
jgi:transcriptional regulator with XRE-family HTH domain